MSLDANRAQRIELDEAVQAISSGVLRAVRAREADFIFDKDIGITNIIIRFGGMLDLVRGGGVPGRQFLAEQAESLGTQAE